MDISAFLFTEYFWFIIIIIVGIVVSKIVNMIFGGVFKKFAKKTKTDIDDKILEIVTKPIHTLIILAFLQVGLKTLTRVQPHMKWIAGIFFVVYILIATHTIGKIIALLVTRWLKVQKKYEKTPKLLNGIITTIIYLIALLMILSHFNVEISPLVAALGLGGLAIGLALQPTLTSLFAGIHIISDKPLQVGDYIELENQKIKGHVEDIGWRSTRLRSVGNNNIITIPNSMLAESIIINDSMPKKDMSLIVQCGVSYESDLEKVEKVSKDVAKKVIKKVEGTIKDYNPLVRFHTFGDSNIDFSIILRIKEYENQYLVRHEFIKALKARFDKEKIEISYPVRKMVK